MSDPENLGPREVVPSRLVSTAFFEPGDRELELLDSVALPYRPAVLFAVTLTCSQGAVEALERADLLLSIETRRYLSIPATTLMAPFRFDRYPLAVVPQVRLHVRLEWRERTLPERKGTVVLLLDHAIELPI
ncbi:MAG TPA: hypothetical protein VKF62_06805 [Planctomycetota bacterium]|nr:hypothetical protein [Planctomycetota bacterium]